MTKIAFHGTSPEIANRIHTEGLDILAKRRSDPGDFGYGLYLGPIRRAKHYGQCIFRFEIDMSRIAYIPNPYRPDIRKPLERFWNDLAFVDTYNLGKYAYEDKETYDDFYHKVRSQLMRTCWNGLRKEYRELASRNIRNTMLRSNIHGILADKIGSGYEIVLYSKVPIISMQFLGCKQ